MAKPMYVAYEKDRPVCVGSAREVADFWGVSEKTVKWFYTSKSWRDRGDSGDRRLVVRVECDT